VSSGAFLFLCANAFILTSYPDFTPSNQLTKQHHCHYMTQLNNLEPLPSTSWFHNFFSACYPSRPFSLFSKLYSYKPKLLCSSGRLRKFIPVCSVRWPMSVDRSLESHAVYRTALNDTTGQALYILISVDRDCEPNA
jgi:hypothetical protein